MYSYYAWRRRSSRIWLSIQIPQNVHCFIAEQTAAFAARSKRTRQRAWWHAALHMQKHRQFNMWLVLVHRNRNANASYWLEVNRLRTQFQLTNSIASQWFTNLWIASASRTTYWRGLHINLLHAKAWEELFFFILMRPIYFW